MCEKTLDIFRRYRFVSAVCLLLASGVFAAEPPGKTDEMQGNALQLDAAVQAYIQGLLSTNEQEMFSGTEDQLRNKLEQLKGIVGGNQAKLVEQLFCYRVNAQGMREALLPMVIMKQLGVSDDALVQGMLPYLESSDTHVVKEASEWLWGTDKNRATGGYDFRRYKAVLEKAKPRVPPGLIRYMYDRDPQTAVVTVVQMYDQNAPESEVSTKAKSGVKESVDYFIGRPEWWAHLYVAAMIEKEPYLRTPEMMKKLEQDDNPLVREKMSKLNDKLQPK
ncbi:MAG: hypothetical protein QME66_13380 [Candidatus Eisenbacteria bacterium]|nr:hypothetical protein [Candidatus Eisenbacteria bacterium]